MSVAILPVSWRLGLCSVALKKKPASGVRRHSSPPARNNMWIPVVSLFPCVSPVMPNPLPYKSLTRRSVASNLSPPSTTHRYSPSSTLASCALAFHTRIPHVYEIPGRVFTSYLSSLQFYVPLTLKPDGVDQLAVCRSDFYDQDVPFIVVHLFDRTAYI